MSEGNGSRRAGSNDWDFRGARESTRSREARKRANVCVNRRARSSRTYEKLLSRNAAAGSGIQNPEFRTQNSEVRNGVRSCNSVQIRNLNVRKMYAVSFVSTPEFDL